MTEVGRHLEIGHVPFQLPFPPGRRGKFIQMFGSKSKFRRKYKCPAFPSHNSNGNVYYYMQIKELSIYYLLLMYSNIWFDQNQPNFTSNQERGVFHKRRRGIVNNNLTFGSGEQHPGGGAEGQFWGVLGAQRL